MRPTPLLFLVPLLAACDDTQFPAPAGGSTVTATADYAGMQAIFNDNCLGCHAAAVALGGLDLETDPCAALVNVTSDTYAAPRVVPGDHESSVIWNKVSGTGVFGQQMPQGGQLDDASIAAIESWIDSGATCAAGNVDTGDSGHALDTATAPIYTFDRVQAIFDENCVRCHADAGENASASAAMWLTADVSYDSIVDHDSLKSGLKRISTDGNPANSFLWHKVSHQLGPGEGASMPYEGQLLPPDQLGLIYGWILAGAPQ